MIKRFIITIFIFGFVIKVFGQDLETLENDLQNTVISDLKKVQNKANKIFRIDPFNETATSYLVSAYNFNNKIKAIPILFAKLKRKNPNSPLPYLLSAKYQFEDFPPSDTSRLAELKKAISLDSNNIEAHYLLGITYYTLFNQKQTNYYAFQCREQLLKTCQLKNNLLFSLKFPIIQTSTFLQDHAFISMLKITADTPTIDSLNMPTNNTFYFPLNSFLNLKNNWESDYSIDIILEVNFSIFQLTWYNRQLFALKEPLVFNQTDKQIYRFTWLRSFHNPVAIRLEKNNNSFTLYWKVTSGAGGYKPGELTVNSSKQLTKKEWDSFIDLLQLTDFWNMPTKSKDEIGTDGSQWIIEGMENGKYHIVDRWTPSNNSFSKCGKYLIELTDLKIKESNFY